MAHEFGHFLGLPDLYDREFESEPEDDSGGIGYWGFDGARQSRLERGRWPQSLLRVEFWGNSAGWG